MAVDLCSKIKSADKYLMGFSFVLMIVKGVLKIQVGQEGFLFQKEAVFFFASRDAKQEVNYIRRKQLE